ncbi:MAG: glycosyltransferase [Pyrinomonadaceae bacterium]|nr:glycosyltransferase [Pyrinomonadaceae bacterium]
MKGNILQLIDSFNQGGTERQTVQLTRLLHGGGRYRVHVACLSGQGPLRAEVERLGLGDIPEFPLTSFYNRNTASQLRRLAAFMRERQIDLVHAHDFYTNIFGMTAAALARIPARIASRRESDGIRSPAKRWVERRAYGLAHAVVANAEAIRQQLIKEGLPPAKVVTVYNGMDTTRVAPQPDLNRAATLAALSLPVAMGRRFVTIVANMRHPMKDQATFLRAARRVREEVPGAAFVLAGEGEQVPSLRSLAAQLGLEPDTFFIGRCARVSDLLAISDVCVLSSKGVEGFSNSIVEYMAAARPVVATDIGGAREAVIDGETGYVVTPEDDETMAARIVSLLRDPELARRMGARGLLDVKEKFSCEAQLERIENLYERLLATTKTTKAMASPSPGVPATRGGGNEQRSSTRA